MANPDYGLDGVERQRPLILTLGLALLAGVALAWIVHLVTPERTVDAAETRRLHEEAVRRHIASRSRALGADTSPIHDPGTVFMPDGTARAETVPIADRIIRETPDEADVFARLAEQARPYREEMIARLRDEADHPDRDDSDQSLTHEQIDDLVRGDRIIQ